MKMKCAVTSVSEASEGGETVRQETTDNRTQKLTISHLCCSTFSPLLIVYRFGVV